MIAAQIHNAIKCRMPHADVVTQAADYNRYVTATVNGTAYKYEKYVQGVGFRFIENPETIEEFAGRVAELERAK